MGLPISMHSNLFNASNQSTLSEQMRNSEFWIRSIGCRFCLFISYVSSTSYVCRPQRHTIVAHTQLIYVTQKLNSRRKSKSAHKSSAPLNERGQCHLEFMSIVCDYRYRWRAWKKRNWSFSRAHMPMSMIEKLPKTAWTQLVHCDAVVPVLISISLKLDNANDYIHIHRCIFAMAIVLVVSIFLFSFCFFNFVFCIT